MSHTECLLASDFNTCRSLFIETRYFSCLQEVNGKLQVSFKTWVPLYLQNSSFPDSDTSNPLYISTLVGPYSSTPDTSPCLQEVNGKLQFSFNTIVPLYLQKSFFPDSNTSNPHYISTIVSPYSSRSDASHACRKLMASCRSHSKP